ncbi:Uncharacterised protein [Vibrio cholerae]|nr:Uncharacterised protein [Vibrio cholerae]
MIENARHHKIDQIVNRLWLMIKTRRSRHDSHAHVRELKHIF